MVTLRKVKAKWLLLNFKLLFVLRYSTDGSASISHYHLLYLEIYGSINNERTELGLLEGDIFPYDIIKEIHMDSKIRSF